MPEPVTAPTIALTQKTASGWPVWGAILAIAVLAVVVMLVFDAALRNQPRGVSPRRREDGDGDGESEGDLGLTTLPGEGTPGGVNLAREPFITAEGRTPANVFRLSSGEWWELPLPRGVQMSYVDRNSAGIIADMVDGVPVMEEYVGWARNISGIAWAPTENVASADLPMLEHEMQVDGFPEYVPSERDIEAGRSTIGTLIGCRFPFQILWQDQFLKQVDRRYAEYLRTGNITPETISQFYASGFMDCLIDRYLVDFDYGYAVQGMAVRQAGDQPGSFVDVGGYSTLIHHLDISTGRGPGSGMPAGLKEMWWGTYYTGGWYEMTAMDKQQRGITRDSAKHAINNRGDYWMELDNRYGSGLWFSASKIYSQSSLGSPGYGVLNASSRSMRYQNMEIAAIFNGVIQPMQLAFMNPPQSIFDRFVALQNALGQFMQGSPRKMVDIRGAIWNLYPNFSLEGYWWGQYAADQRAYERERQQVEAERAAMGLTN